MAYVKQNFFDGMTLYASQLEAMENAILDLEGRSGTAIIASIDQPTDFNGLIDAGVYNVQDVAATESTNCPSDVGGVLTVKTGNEQEYPVAQELLDSQNRLFTRYKCSDGWTEWECRSTEEFVRQELQAKMPEAINTALAQAKASGEFKGDKGDKGDTGATGSAGKDGTSVTVKSVTESTADGGSNVVTFSDGKTVTIKNGKTGATGAQGQRGTGLLSVTTGPSSYTTEVGGITPKYRLAISTIKSQAGVTEVLLGDTIRYSYYHYPIAYLDGTYAYCTTRVSIRGATGSAGAAGADGKTAYQYAQDGGYTGTEEEFAQKLAAESCGYVAQPEPPEDTNLLWIDTDDDSGESGSAPADWNASEGEPGHILNRTHYEGISTIVEETTAPGSTYEGALTMVNPIEIGSSYTVSWDGDSYTCDCFEFMGGACIGNPSAMGGDDTGEPFFMLAAFPQMMYLGFDEAKDIQIKIEGQTVVRIPEKYIPTSFIRAYAVTVTDEEWATLDSDMVTLTQSYDPFIDILCCGGTVRMKTKDTGSGLNIFSDVQSFTLNVNQGEHPELGAYILMMSCRVFSVSMFTGTKDITFIAYGNKLPTAAV